MNFDVIEQKRKDKNLTVTSLCKMAGIDRKTYYKAMDSPESIRFSTVTKLVQALKLNASEKAQVLN